MEAWEKVYLSEKKFLESTHGKLGCVTCHGGVGSANDKDAAHKGVVRVPPADKACASCHSSIVKNWAKGLHATLDGMKAALTTRGADWSNPNVMQAYKDDCSRCHASCGQCHVSRPAVTGYGFLQSHTFKKTPPLEETCMVCHAARPGAEFVGDNKGALADVHFSKGGMLCTKCHVQAQFHGDNVRTKNRYEGAPTPNCLDCHPKAAPGQSTITQHNVHGNKLACQVCHSAGVYKNCFNCHINKNEKGVAARSSDPTELTMKIGLNPSKSATRPWNYVMVRHIPTMPTMLDAYAKNLLPKFDALPTWKYATPHNIQRRTPQNATCDSCHGNAKLFLTDADLKPYDQAANQGVIVPKIPPKVGQ